jgi:hypothetical protein
MSDRVRESIALPDYHDRSTEKQGRIVAWIERGLERISPTEPCLPLSSSRSSALISDLTSQQTIRNIATGLASSHWSRPISITELASLIDTGPPRASGSAKLIIHPEHTQTRTTSNKDIQGVKSRNYHGLGVIEKRLPQRAGISEMLEVQRATPGTKRQESREWVTRCPFRHRNRRGCGPGA